MSTVRHLDPQNFDKLEKSGLALAFRATFSNHWKNKSTKSKKSPQGVPSRLFNTLTVVFCTNLHEMQAPGGFVRVRPPPTVRPGAHQEGPQGLPGAPQNDQKRTQIGMKCPAWATLGRRGSQSGSERAKTSRNWVPKWSQSGSQSKPNCDIVAAFAAT